MELISGKFAGYFRMGILLHSRNVLVLLDLLNGARSCIKVYILSVETQRIHISLYFTVMTFNALSCLAQTE